MDGKVHSSDASNARGAVFIGHILVYRSHTLHRLAVLCRAMIVCLSIGVLRRETSMPQIDSSAPTRTAEACRIGHVVNGNAFALVVVLGLPCASMTPTLSYLPLLALLLCVTALEYTPSGSFAPSIVKCPRGDNAVTIRPATCLSEPEKAFRAKRAPNVISAMEKYLKRVNVPGFDADECDDELESSADRADTSASCASAQRRRP